MLIDQKKILDTQLSITEQRSFTSGAGRETTLIPVRQTPKTDRDDMLLSLDGEWKVKRWPFRISEKKLAEQKTRDSKWESLTQPGKVFYADPEGERIGTQAKNWNRVTLAHIDENDGAILRKEVKVPRNWKNKRIVLRFDSIFPAGRIYINGHFLGEHLSALTPVEYDVTHLVKAGSKTLIAVRLIRRHKYVQMDMVRHACEFGGLAQSACLFATEYCYMESYQLIPELNKNLKSATLNGNVIIRNDNTKSGSGTLKVSLFNTEGKRVCQSTNKIKLKNDTSALQPVKISIKKPKLWNDEYPNLYTVKLELVFSAQDKQVISYRTGFRKFELTPKGPRLNGSPVKFRGVNHLTFHPDHGMHTPRAWLKKNLEMMKKANVNCIRTHFLGPRDLADLCDEIGIYLMQELPIDWGTDYIADVNWVGPALQRIMGGILRDRHHTSLMVWCVGNENLPSKKSQADDGWNHMAIYDAFTKILDPSRPNMFPPPGPANTIKGIFELRVGNIADTHYSFNLVKDFLKSGKCVQPNSWEADMKKVTTKSAIKRGWSGVWFSSEWGIFNMIPDMMNNPYMSIIEDFPEDPLNGKNTQQVFNERLMREWGLMRSEPTCLGGAYFPWICAGAGAGPGANPWGWVRWAEDSDWGPITADLTPKPFFWSMRKAYAPIQFPDRITWKKGQRSISFQLENQFNAIDLKDCTIRTQQGSGKWMAMLRTFDDIPMSLAPGKKKKVSIPIWDKPTLNSLNAGQYGVCRVNLLNPDGFRVIAHDILIIPEKLGGKAANAMPIGPDAVL